MNEFIKQSSSYDALTQNGAVSHSTSGNAVLDYFYKVGTARNRQEEIVFADFSRVYGENPLDALKVMFYNRMITRKPKGFFESEESQKGQGNRDEFVKCLKWLEISYPEVLNANLWLVPVVGCWKDLWHDSAASKYHHYVNPNKVYALIERGLADPFNRQLLGKFLPKYRSKSNCKNERHQRINKWVNGLCNHLGWTHQQYRKFKSNPELTAHAYQRTMSANLWDDLNFNLIPGKALFNMVSRKGKDNLGVLERHKQVERYMKWAESRGTIQFTGYVYELFAKAKDAKNLIQKMTFDRQFEHLLSLARNADGSSGIKGNVWCALDTSGSMSMPVGNTTAYDICVSLGIFFSSLNEGAFKDHVIMFDNESRKLKLAGTFTDKCQQIRSSSVAWGSTNFQSVIDEIVRIRNDNPEIPVSDYPQTLLVVSDMQFNPTDNWHYSNGSDDKISKTNYEVAMSKLQKVRLPPIQIIWWNVNAQYGQDVPSKKDDVGVSLLSGFDGSIIQLILGGDAKNKPDKKPSELTPEETMRLALDQVVLNQLSC